jgi:hypothetical protein
MNIIKINKLLSKPLVNLETKIELQFENNVNLLKYKAKTIIELGGVSRPVLKKSKKYEYVGIDIDNSFEYSEYYDSFFCQSVEYRFPIKGDLIFSKYLMEHVGDVKLAYKHQIEALNQGGSILHLYPLGYHPFSLINKFFGNKVSKKFIDLFRKEHKNITGYPAFYDLGNAYMLEKHLREYDIEVEFIYHYGATDYFSFFFPFAVCISIFNSFCSTLKLKLFASNVLILITKK